MAATALQIRSEKNEEEGRGEILSDLLGEAHGGERRRPQPSALVLQQDQNVSHFPFLPMGS
ncbi:hypothetical protein [Methylacidimicrobium cyclopophantes]|uniref:hypothetical protein n=1 Tax=Methylacidimicrobium cyclopophantes TaxID=1041766 RepID=UPI0011581C60|nr:hypothetical protein [Methylacidimicrobium cyclopophantes]